MRYKASSRKLQLSLYFLKLPLQGQIIYGANKKAILLRTSVAIPIANITRNDAIAA